MKRKRERPVILLVEDNPGDVRLTQEAIKDCNVDIQLFVVSDGEQVVEYLNKRGRFADAVRPDLILLDLNLPKKNGNEVLKEIKGSQELRSIPVVVLTTSDAEHDVQRAYDSGANSYILKPVDFDEFALVIKQLENYWLSTVQLPR